MEAAVGTGIVVTSLILSGCASSVAIKALRPATETRPIVLTQDFLYDISTDSDLPRPEAGAVRGLLAGTYVPEFEDDRGTFYRGQGTCVVVNSNPVSSKRRFVQQGGVWIEKGTATPQFRLYRDLNVTSMVVQPFEGASGLSPCGGLGSSASGAASTKDGAALPVMATQPIVIPANATPLQAGLGAGLANGIVQAMISADKDKLLFMPAPAPGIRIDGRFSQASR